MNIQFKKGVLDMCVLAMLREKDSYGYDIADSLSKKIKLRIGPDFERKVIYTDTHMKGHITLFTALYIAATCYFNKDIKKTIKRFKKILNS